MPRPALSALVLVLVVAALHAAALWLLLVASRPHARPAAPMKRIAMALVQIVTPSKPVAPAQPATAPRTAPAAAAPRATPRRAPPPARSDAITVAPEAPAEPPQAAAPPIAAPLVLDTEATRRAIRDVARQRSFADRANQDLHGPARSAFDTPLGAGVAGAARGDCMRGQFKGSNMGLLSLPMLALAAAQGECH